MREDRSLIKYILLSIITFGFYGIYFLHAYARDMNIVCSGDGRRTAGALKVILLTAVTCGIYAFIWYYKVGERINENCVRRGISSPCTGGSLLCWFIFGSLIYIGPFVMMHKMIKGLNLLCAAYNRSRSGFAGNVTVNINL